MSTELVPKQNQAVAAFTFSDMQNMARVIVNSGLFGMKNDQQALGLMLIAQAHGRHPALVAEEYDIIQGRPAMKAHAMLSRYQEAGGNVRWIERTDTACEAEFTHAQSGSVKIRWTYEMAVKAQLTGKDNYKKHPRQMLSARVVSEGVKASFPGCIGAVYAPEEAAFFEPQTPENVEAEVLESTPVAVDQPHTQDLSDIMAKAKKYADDCETIEELTALKEEMIAKGQPYWSQETKAVLAARHVVLTKLKEQNDELNRGMESAQGGR